MLIQNIYETSYPGMYKLETDETKFFIRPEYIPNIPFDSIEPGVEFTDEQADALADAGLASLVELKAVEYLARAEQSRFGLSRKLLEKKYEKKYVDMALTLLEAKGYLSDQRFSSAWLNSRKINHYEGKTKLMAELQSRGISKEVAQKAVAVFFEENDEEEICAKAYERFVKRGKEGEKLTEALMQAGFSYKLIKSVITSFEE